MAEKSPETVLRKQENLLDERLGQEVFGPPRSGEYSETTYPLDFDPDQASLDPDSSYHEVFPHAGDLRLDLNLDSFTEVVNLLSANPRSADEGHINRAAFLYAIDENPPAEMVLGLRESTYETVFSEFEDADLVYMDDEGPQLSSAGREVMNAMSPIVQEFDDYREASMDFARIAGQKPDCPDRLLTFLYTMETDDYLTEISGSLDAGRRTVAKRYEKMRDERSLFTGEPDNRRRTPRGEKNYQSLTMMAHRLDRVSDQDYISAGSEF